MWQELKKPLPHLMFCCTDLLMFCYIEDCCLDFPKFGQDIQVHLLDRFLKYVNNFSVKNFEMFLIGIANNIISGLKYLYEYKVVHHDVEPAYMYLHISHISNRHYTSTETRISNEKIICILTDFGEAWSFIQTQTRLTTSTSGINKGNNM